LHVEEAMQNHMTFATTLLVYETTNQTQA